MPPVWNWYEAFLMPFQFPRCLIGWSGFRFECQEKYPWISFLSVLLGNPKKDLKLGSSQDLQFRTPPVISGKKGPDKLGFKNYETVKKKNPSNLDWNPSEICFRLWVLLHNPQSVLQINPDFLIGTILYFVRSRKSHWKILKYWRMFSHHCFLAGYRLCSAAPMCLIRGLNLFCFCCFCFDCIEWGTIMDVIVYILLETSSENNSKKLKQKLS